MADIQNNLWPGWETVKEIGNGSFGAVYEIQRNMLGDVEKAALKVISIPQHNSEIEEMYSDGYNEESITTTFHSYLKSIINEYALMRKLNGCANIVSCDDVRYVQHDNGIGWDVYIKMELLTPLTKALPAEIPEETVIQIGKDLCAALVLCKKHDIIHRDIKPQNIFLSPNGDYKLGDFGIAKTVEKTTGGTKAGTYRYMAPEVYNNQPYGTGADIYSLGLVLYWMLNERRTPFLPLPPEPLRAGIDDHARLRRFSGEPIPAPVHGSDALKAIVLKACAFDPKDRYQTAAEMLQALQSIGSATPAFFQEKTAAPIYEALTSTQSTDAVASEIQDSVQESASENSTVGLFSQGTNAQKTTSQPTDKDATVGIFQNLSYGERTVEPEQENLKENARKDAILAQAATAMAIGTDAGYEAALQLLGTIPDWKDASARMAYCRQWLLRQGATAQAISSHPSKNSSKLLVVICAVALAAVVGIVLLMLLKPWQATGSSQGGTWSGWSYSLPAHVTPQDYTIESRNILTTTSNQSSLPGWTLYETGTGAGEYGSWSDWSVTPVTATDYRQVQTATWYQYQDITYTEETIWNAPGDWVTQRESTNSLKKEETATVYAYFYYLCPDCGAHMHGWGHCAEKYGGCGTGYVPQDAYYLHWYNIPYGSVNLQPFYDAHYNDHIYYYTEDINGIVYFQSTKGSTQGYRYTTGSVEKTEQLSDWSAPTAMQPAASPMRNIREVTVYSYCERTDTNLYYYYCWEDAATQQTLGSAADIQRSPVYRYKQK